VGPKNHTEMGNVEMNVTDKQIQINFEPMKFPEPIG